MAENVSKQLKKKGKGGKKNRKYGRNKIKCAEYTRENRRFRNKLRRVRRSNGETAAKRYEARYAEGPRKGPLPMSSSSDLPVSSLRGVRLVA